jgi:hypothetical protein
MANVECGLEPDRIHAALIHVWDNGIVFTV